MEFNDKGWIKLYRILLDKPIWTNSTPEQCKILITLLLMANHEEAEWEWQREKFKVKPGQFITSLDNIVKKCGKGISIQNVRTSLKRFEELKFLTNKSTKNGRLISIENWELYQYCFNDINKGSNIDLTKTQQRANKDLTPNNNNNNNKNNKNDSISKDILVPKHLVPIQDKWNSLGLSKIRDIKGNRLKLLNARIKEYGIDGVLEAIENIKTSSFLKGQNKNNWVIVFDWFIKPNNFIKVLEGNYNNDKNEYVIKSKSIDEELDDIC